MLEYNQITAGKYISLDGEPYEVISSHVFRKQQRKPVNSTKLKNLITGKVVERSFHVSEKAEEADMGTKDVVYIFSKKDEHWFHQKGDPSQRFAITGDIVGDKSKFLKEGMEIPAIEFDQKIIGLKFPIKMELEVTDAPPAVKGNTAQGGVKQITLETGAVTNAPMFINEGDVVRINTDTGEYVERVSN